MAGVNFRFLILDSRFDRQRRENRKSGMPCRVKLDERCPCNYQLAHGKPRRPPAAAVGEGSRMPTFKLRLREELTEDKKAVIFVLDGQLDTYSFELLNGAIQSHFEAKRFKFLFDITGVDYVSSTCMGVLMAALSTSIQNGGQIIILNAAPKVRVVFELFGLTEMFTLTTDRQAALAKLQSA
jgi:anti-anti-sigma factor